MDDPLNKDIIYESTLYAFFKSNSFFPLSLSVASLREKCPNTELFLVRILLYLDWIRKRPCSVQIQGNTDQK